MTDINDPAVEWFDTFAKWPSAMRQATFFAKHCRSRIVVRWMPQYHRWYMGFRR